MGAVSFKLCRGSEFGLALGLALGSHAWHRRKPDTTTAALSVGSRCSSSAENIDMFWGAGSLWWYLQRDWCWSPEFQCILFQVGPLLFLRVQAPLGVGAGCNGERGRIVLSKHLRLTG